jgi:hypothetical protein
VTYEKLVWSFLGDDAFLMVNKKLARLLGLNEAIYLSDLISKHKYFIKNNNSGAWFFNTRENIEEDTCLSSYQQRQVEAGLIDKKLLVIKRKGVPCKNYFLINYRLIIRLLSTPEETKPQILRNFTSDIKKLNLRSEETKPQILRNFTPINNINNKTKNKNELIKIEPKGSLEKTRKRSDEEVHVFQLLYDVFREKHGADFEPGIKKKEVLALWQLIDKGKSREPNNLEGFLKALVAQFWIMKKQSRDKFFNNRPFLPSQLNSSGIYPQVLERVKAKADIAGQTMGLIEGVKL